MHTHLYPIAGGGSSQRLVGRGGGGVVGVQTQGPPPPPVVSAPLLCVVTLLGAFSLVRPGTAALDGPLGRCLRAGQRLDRSACANHSTELRNWTFVVLMDIGWRINIHSTGLTGLKFHLGSGLCACFCLCIRLHGGVGRDKGSGLPLRGCP